MFTTIIVEMKAKPECVSALTDMMQAALPDTRAFAGCQGLQVFANQDEPQTFVFTEQWSSRDAYQRYLAWRTDNGTLTQLANLLEGPPIIRFFDTVAA